MDFLTYILFDDPTTLWVLLAIAWVVLLILWRRTHSPGLVRPLIVLPLAAVGFLVLDLVVETDHEALLRSLKTMAKAADSGDATAFMQQVSVDYRSGTFDKAALARAVGIGLTHFRATAGPPLTQPETLPDGTRVYVVSQTYRFRPSPGGTIPLPPPWQTITWEGRFRKDKDGQWRLARATATDPERITAEEAIARVLSRLPMR